MTYKTSTRKIQHQPHNKTNKTLNKIYGEKIGQKEGWLVISIYGDAYDRGFAHGALLHKELKEIIRVFPFLVDLEFHIDFDHYLKTCSRIISPIIEKDFPEFYEEIRGISHGAKSKNVHISIDYLIAWNSMLSMYSYFLNTQAYKCSAFIATGDATTDGQIVMAHDTHTDYVSGRMQNIIMYVYPTNGHSFVMQTAAGYIASGTDWFICSSGMMGCETTISNVNYRPEFGSPFFVRIRQAMQYGNTIDEYVSIMLKDNAGDYACSWLLGDNRSGEIALFEVAMKKHSLRKTKNGVYYGMNTAIDLKLRSQETTDNDFLNLEKSSGARNFRLNQLLNIDYYGKIDTKIAKKVLSDHYDVFLNKNEMNSRSICKHSEYDIGKFTGTVNYPFGCTDAKITNSSMAKDMMFDARFGSACGRVFNASAHIRKNPQYKKWSPYLKYFPKRKWIKIKT